MTDIRGRPQPGAGLLRKIADEVNDLPQDHELDPGRGESAERLRRWAHRLDEGKGPDLV